MKKSRGGRERKNNGDKGGTLFPRFKEKFKRVSCHWKREEGESLVNEGEEKNVSSKNSSREKKREKEKKLRTFSGSFYHLYTDLILRATRKVCCKLLLFLCGVLQRKKLDRTLRLFLEQRAC